MTVNGTLATIPVPTSLPYTTTLSYANASVIAGTTVAVQGGRTLPAGLPSLSFKRVVKSGARVVAQLPGSAQLLEYVMMQPSQPLVGIDGLTVTANVPLALAQPAGVHYWAMLCLTDLGDSSCQGWDGPFGPAAVAISGSTATLSVRVPVPALPGGLMHTVALYAIPDGTLPALTSAPGDVTSFITAQNDPLADPNPIPSGSLGISFSVNDPTYSSKTPFVPNGVAYGNAAIGQNGSTEPLDVSEAAVWKNDLPLIVGMHANALRVYSVSTNAPSAPPPGFSLVPYLNLAYQGPQSKQTVYTLLGAGMGAPSANAKTTCAGTIYTPLPLPSGGPNYLSCYGASGEYNSWVTYYEWLARKWGAYPGVMGFVIGNETNDSNDVPSTGFWRQIVNIGIAIRESLATKSYGVKLVVYSAVNDMSPNKGTVAMYEGEQAMQLFTPPPPPSPMPSMTALPQLRSAGFDVWGYDVYEGPPWGGGCPSSANTCWFNLASQYTKRPVTILEFGTQASEHPSPVPGNSATPYAIAEVMPHPTASPATYASPWPCTTPFPVSNTPTFKDIVTFYGCMQQGIDDYSVTSSKYLPYNVVSGGFVFELMDEYFKGGGGGCTYYHCASTNPLNYLYNNENSNGYLLYFDEAFDGLMSVGFAPPNYTPVTMLSTQVDTRTPRETYCWFQNHWSGAAGGGSNQSPCVPQMRFVNGAPAAKNVTPVGASFTDQNVPPSTQASITAYHPVVSGSYTPTSYTITFTGSGGPITLQTPCVTPVLLASSRTTIVLTGNGTTVPYACQIFDEPEVTNTQVVAVYHHAAALYANANGNNPLYALYSYALPASAIQYASGLGFQKIYFGGPAVLFDYLPIAGYNNNTQYGSGIALEVNSAGQFGPNNGQPVATLASFTPVSADPANTGDYMPSTSGGQGLTPNSYNLSGADANVALFVVDNGAGGVSLIGTFTP